jgi:processing peptidase subunit beta
LREYESRKIVERESVCEVSRLDNGIRVLTLSEDVPNVVDMSVLLDMGSRDETIETSGSMLALKNTFLKTALRTNETVNYGMV